MLAAIIATLVMMVSALVLGLVLVGFKRRHMSNWLDAYFARQCRQMVSPTLSSQGPTHILFCIVDHFEPIGAGSTKDIERRRMRAWLERYPALAHAHLDSDGKAAQHTWFYPGEDYDAEYLDALVALCQMGLGDIELHLHHGDDTAETLQLKIEQALSNFTKHGALRSGSAPRGVYGFIHGNNALDNSRFDSCFCGVNNELAVLAGTGCYADFTMPTAPCVSQTAKVNSIYYAKGDPLRPKSHDRGTDVEVGRAPSGDLMIVSGPLALNWRRRKWGLFPRIENADIQASNPPTPDRVRLWVSQKIHVRGRPEWVIVKVSCHGAPERSHDVLLGEAAHNMYAYLEARFRDRAGFALHYVTARELYNIVKAAEAGESGNPDKYRDYVIPKYLYQTVELGAVREASLARVLA